jgi:hypothetical protein
MSEKESLQGLTCPNCGGVVPIPEGHVIVRCPYCELRSFVKGDRGLLRYQVPQKISRESAFTALQTFFSGNMAAARDLGRKAQVSESFLVYLPFWTVWGRVAGWVFGEKKVGSGDRSHYEPREVRQLQEMTWSSAACDVGEFGINQLQLTDQEIQPFNPEQLHSLGMVFEPVNSSEEAQQAAEDQFEAQVQRQAGLDRLSQLFVRTFRRRNGLVYYPLWVLRYLYRERAFQVVVDGYSGRVLYGKAPGSTVYRAAVLVLGMATGAFLTIDVSAAILYFMSDSDNAPIWLVLAAFVGGLALMYTAYRRFRYGEQIEFRSGGGKGGLPALKGIGIDGLDNPLKMFGDVTNVKDIEQWINRLT